jgi:hypothetical protein
MKRLLALMAVATALGGCVSDSEYFAQADDGDCRSYGAHPGSQAYFQCRMIKSEQHSLETAEKNRAADELMVEGLKMMAGEN